MQIRLLVAALLVSIVGCSGKTPDSTDVAAPTEGIAEFSEIAGLRLGDSRTDLETVFGPPESVGNPGDVFEILGYLDGGLSFGVDTSTGEIFLIDLWDHEKLSASGLINKRQIELIGKPGWLVPNRYGPPDPSVDVDSGALGYRFFDGETEVSVRFYCGFRLLEPCTQIRLLRESR